MSSSGSYAIFFLNYYCVRQLDCGAVVAHFAAGVGLRHVEVFTGTFLVMPLTELCYPLAGFTKLLLRNRQHNADVVWIVETLKKCNFKIQTFCSFKDIAFNPLATLAH